MMQPVVAGPTGISQACKRFRSLFRNLLRASWLHGVDPWPCAGRPC